MVFALLAAPASADELRPASLEFVQRDAQQWSLGWKQPLADPNAPLAVPVLPENCRYSASPFQRKVPAALVANAAVTCKGEVAGKSMGAPDLVVSSDALLRVVPLDGDVQNYRLSASQPLAMLAAEQETIQVWRTYFVLGVEHILEGWDHLLFVIALVLLVVRGWEVVKAATAFTVAHSITLAAVTLGAAGLPQRPVEALIALSIVFLAIEIARAQSGTITQRLPWVVAFGFGLVHGFGFAGALREIGLPQGEVPAALLSFNLGVEAGQLAVIAAVVAARAIIARLAPRSEAPAVRIAAYAIGITGSYWLVDRVVG